MYQTKTPSGQRIWVVEGQTLQGYEGLIKVMLSFNDAFTMQQGDILYHTETPGLGDKIERQRSNWLDQFQQKIWHPDLDHQWQVKPDGGPIDAFSGATITPRAVSQQFARMMQSSQQLIQAYAQGAACEAQ